MSPHQQRRQQLAERIRKEGGGVAVLTTGREVMRNADADYPYRSDSYFSYLTGFYSQLDFNRRGFLLQKNGRRIGLLQRCFFQIHALNVEGCLLLGCVGHGVRFQVEVAKCRLWQANTTMCAFRRS